MAKTPAERTRDYRERKSKGIKPIFRNETAAQRVRRYRRVHYDELEENRKSFKIEVLTHYGGGICACVECGENRNACLTIDHIEGSGRKHRKAIKAEGHGFYMWLKKNGFPGEFRTLCMNCQWVKRYKNREYNHLNTVASVASVASVAKQGVLLLALLFVA